MVPAHVEPHAAPSIPQPVRARRADVAEQEICHGMSRGRGWGTNVSSQLWALWAELILLLVVVVLSSSVSSSSSSSSSSLQNLENS